MDFVEGHTVGIDLGTTFSAIAKLDDDGNPQPIANEDDEVETPSLVLLAEGGHVIVGPSRMRAAMEDPDRVVERVKREMGNADYKKVFEGQELTAEFISALILKKLRQDAAKRIGPIANAVITVPYYFNDARRKATQDAGRIAGLNVIDIINEPTAAALTYAWNQGELGGVHDPNQPPKKVMVYDLGGGTFDVTLVQYTPTHFEVLGTDGDVHLGGLDWTDRLVDYVAETFMERHKIDPRETATSLQLLRNDCDLAKIALSEQDKVSITCRHGGKAVTVPVTREKFEELTVDLLQRTLDTTELVLDTAEVSPADLDAVVLVGGSTLMPTVPARLEEILGIKPYQGLSPHTAVAQGAAIHAAILEAKFRKDGQLAAAVKKRLAGVKQENVNSHGLGVVIRHPRTNQYVNEVMIPRNSKLPIEVKRTFATHEENQNRASVKVVEGEAPDPAACSMIGKCTIHGLPANLPKNSPIEVRYRFNEAGRVEIFAKDQSSGKQAKIHIQRGGGLDDQQIDSYTRLATNYTVD